MRAGFKHFSCLLCSIILITINVSVFAQKTVDDAPADAPNENMAAAYGTVLNDFINEYGVISDEHPNGFMDSDDCPNGLVYADIVNFENDEDPYLVLFLADSAAKSAECSIWGYDSDKNRPMRCAGITKSLMDFKDSRGHFSLGWNNEKRYIVFTELKENGSEKDYFTVINGETFEYVAQPEGVSEAAVINFNSKGVYPDVDVSYYNKPLSDFFDRLKNIAADSVTYEDIADSFEGEELTALESAAALASVKGNFDILKYGTIDEYEKALDEQNAGEGFGFISNVYSLGEEMYYVRFSANSSFYNYTLLRRTERNEKYQILKTRMDCIPLSDRELNNLRNEYKRSALLYKKAKSEGVASPTRAPQHESFAVRFPKLISPPKLIDRSIRKPAVYIGAALTVFLITGLWVYIYGDDEEAV